ncbi:hybrid sensor histidine kinase/response regulator transcription factor [Mucilaginibacter sp.]|uniref:hybrid sensor histidine kinase/response regulator transcription factor n=1 Tax=Mucilaginibacter sp. TaxID=1882438 RepID=UPI003D0E1330
MGFKVYLTFIVAIFMQQVLFAQTDVYKFSHLDITNGLSDNQVNCIFKDDKGFMWFGTTSGLNRYDGYKFRIFKHDAQNSASLGENNVTSINQGPENKLWIFTHSAISIYNAATETFSRNITAQLAAYNIPASQIKSVKKDQQGNFWFLTEGKGLYCYNTATRTTAFYNSSSKSKVALYSNYVVDIIGGQHNMYWLIYNDGTIDQLNTLTNRILFRYSGFTNAVGVKLPYFNLTADNKGNLWIYSNGKPIGVYCYNRSANSLIHFSKDLPVNKLNSNIINSIVQADDNKIWIGTDHGGINVVDPITNKISYVMNKEDDPKSLSGNSIFLFKDNTGIIWAGTFKQGANYYHTGIMQFPLNRHFTTDKRSLPYDDVDCFAEDELGNLWIGTNGGGLIYFNRVANTYTQYKHDAANPSSLSNDIVVRLRLDHEHKLWIGMYFGGLDRFDGKQFTHYRHNDKIPGSLSDDRVYSILEDSKNNIWVGTFTGGLNIYDPKHNNFLHPQYGLSSYYTSTVYEDTQHNIWVGRDQGVDVIENNTHKVKHYYNKPKDANSLVANDVNTIIQDSRGLMWIGTKDGLSILNPKTDQFLTANDGFSFPSSNISNILEDNYGQLWVSTNNGLANIRLTQSGGKYQFQVNNFNEFDGLQGRGFNMNAAFKMKNGLLMFGGAHGFNLFDPGVINTFKPKQNLVFTDFQLFNKSVVVGDAVKGKPILERSISETKSITLNHNQNVFSIEFAACDYFNPDKIKYQYTLDGFDKGWINAPSTDRKAIYTNLDGGDYLFKVRAKNANDAAYGNIIMLKIKVLPPFWKTTWAYLSYLVLAFGLVLYLRHRGIVKLQKQFELRQDKIEAERKIENEREEARRMHQLDLMKIKFFTNVSHEFRTPLSLILSPIDDLIKVTDKPEQQQRLVMIKRNGKRLLNLVNQLLDFRKMEYNELKLCLSKGDIVKFIKEVSSSFTDVAHQKQIEYLFESEVSSFVTDFDQDKIERILFNLLSNAFKFTPSGGHISVMLSLSAADAAAQQQKTLDIRIIDTGIGIPKEKQEKIFERFFQDSMPESLLNQGSGIGLSITKEFVKMHGGTITIESEPDYGSCFSVSIPVGEQFEDQQVDLPQQDEAFVYPVLKSVDTSPGAAKKPAILLIEDNDDLRFYLKDNLKQSFHVIEAVNGKDGWQKALALHPKLIVSDINMPEMNGVELCKKIKADERTAQIPIILLTALTGEKEQLAGLDGGANDYIIKPFNFEILLSKIHNLLRMQQTMKKTYQKQMEIQATDVVVVSEDAKFLKNALDCIELNITNPNFSVEELSRQLNLSRVSLYKKLLTLTGKTPVDCIRTIRLKRAVQLLEKSKLSIANIGYEVGFNNAAYFAKVFKEEYGILPSEYINEMRNRLKEDLLA